MKCVLRMTPAPLLFPPLTQPVCAETSFLYRARPRVGHAAAPSPASRAAEANNSYCADPKQSEAGQRDKAEATLQTLLKGASHGEDLAMILAQDYAALGKKEPAFAWLEKAYRNHEGGLVLLGVAPAFRPIRSDPRFENLMRGMRLAEK